MSVRNWRDRIVHAYYKIDEKLMWDTIKKDLPPLISILEKLI